MNFFIINIVTPLMKAADAAERCKGKDNIDILIIKTFKNKFEFSLYFFFQLKQWNTEFQNMFLF